MQKNIHSFFKYTILYSLTEIFVDERWKVSLLKSVQGTHSSFFFFNKEVVLWCYILHWCIAFEFSYIKRVLFTSTKKRRTFSSVCIYLCRRSSYVFFTINGSKNHRQLYCVTGLYSRTNNTQQRSVNISQVYENIYVYKCKN